MNTNREREVQRERGREREGERGRERGGERGREREGEREKKEEENKLWDQQTVFKRICPHGAKTIRNHPPLPFFRGPLRGATGNYGYSSKEQLMLWSPTLMEAHTQARALICLVLVPPLVFGSLSFQSPI